MAARTVIYDIGGVLEITPPTGWLGAWQRRFGWSDERLALLDPVWAAGELGEIGEQEVYERIAGTLGLGPARLAEFTADLWAEYLGTANHELLAHLRSLREGPRPCRTGILSNSFVGAREREAAAYGFPELVDVLVYSHEAGVRKPDPAAYALVCELLAARPEDCLFLDDVPESIAAAERAGLRGHLFTGDNAAAIARITAHRCGS